MAHIRIGISGWQYAPWRKVFYPADLPHKRELAFASSALFTIEINGTFYSMKRRRNFITWRDETPDGFLFSVKASRFITHIKRLREVKIPIANFFASGVLHLEEKLGPILWQLPPSFKFNQELVEEFLALLPHSRHDAATLARLHDRIKDPSFISPKTDGELRHAMEIRNETFVTPEFYSLLKRHDVALVVADTAGKWPLIEEPTTDFMYLRLHGDKELYASGYSDKALRAWAKKIKTWSNPTKGTRRKKRDIFVYFDNDVKVHAPDDAARLNRLCNPGKSRR